MLGMISRVPSQRPCGWAGRCWALCGIFALALVCISTTGHAAQQSAQKHTNIRQSSAASSNLLDAEELLRQGLVDRAKERVQAELQRNPSSIEGYNLLGII